MLHLLICHAQTDANRVTRQAFGKQGAPLNDVGIQQATLLRQQVLAYHLEPTNEPVAVSGLLRTKQTAEIAGFTQIIVNSVLNEINTPDPQKTSMLIRRGILPEEATAAARKVLANPPKEMIWITHGLLIAAILVELKLAAPRKLIPGFCEIREIRL